ncbi:hypothetical protein Poly30_12780 [Planctomycetes bacterium Poly30]|uniref:SMP-30/Gluconolaconase/LRE-like region n=1 Tax=Saltatorellus ferox TaxID=2528018 RepID=A0A518ENX0_9BACT|nr:hypothetical protein Poly30_12780 [Planctomycetes bacterium Poly30]
MNRLLLTPLAALLIPSLASAQVAYGTDDVGMMDNFFLDTASGVSTGPIFTGSDSWGMADDSAASIYYINDGGNLFTAPFASAGGAATSLGQIVQAGTTTLYTMTALAYENGVLYSHRNIATEALYTIDLVTYEATPVLVYSSTTIDIGGLSVDPATGLLLGSNDASGYTDPQGNSGTGIVVFDITTASETITYPYPTGETDIDGIAFDPSGTIWYLEDEPAPLHNLDTATMMFDPNPPMNAILGSEVFSAGTFTGVNGGGLGTPYCMANPNSTGATGSLAAAGSVSAAANDVTLNATNLPTSSFGFFITSQVQGFVMNPAGSSGNLCLSGAIGRYVGAGQIQNTGAAGSFSLALDLTQTPTPTGLVSIAAGETWNFQAWHRDSSATGPTSNFTNGLQIDFN